MKVVGLFTSALFQTGRVWWRKSIGQTVRSLYFGSRNLQRNLALVTGLVLASGSSRLIYDDSRARAKYRAPGLLQQVGDPSEPCPRTVRETRRAAITMA